MSDSEPTDTARQALKSIKELLEKAEESTHRVLEKAAPAVQKSLDVSMEAAASGFNATMKSIDGATAREQLEVLRAYRKFLDGQGELVASRIRALESKSQTRSQGTP